MYIFLFINVLVCILYFLVFLSSFYYISSMEVVSEFQLALIPEIYKAVFANLFLDVCLLQEL